MTYIVIATFTLTTKQLAFLIFCFCYNELEVTFRKIHFIKTDNDVKKQKIRWALFSLFGVSIIILNILYRTSYVFGNKWIFAL